MKLLYITNGINGSGGLERVLSIKASYLADNLDYEVAIANNTIEYLDNPKFVKKTQSLQKLDNRDKVVSLRKIYEILAT